MLAFFAGFFFVGIPSGTRNSNITKLLGFYLRENPQYSVKINTGPIRDFFKKFQTQKEDRKE